MGAWEEALGGASDRQASAIPALLHTWELTYLKNRVPFEWCKTAIQHLEMGSGILLAQ